jgi:putative oxidoreductase
MDSVKHLFENRYFSASVRIVLGALFIYSSLDKIANTAEFAKIVHNYHLLPEFSVNLFAMALPWAELLTGVLLLTGKYSKGAALLYTFMLVIFIIALLQAALRGININCGCFSLKGGETSDVWLRILLDLIMLFFSFNLYLAVPVEKEVLVQPQN